MTDVQKKQVKKTKSREKFDPLLIERGKRVKKIRSMLDMPLREFAKFCESGMSTISQWEHGRLGGLAERSARRIVAALQQSEIVCSEEWLLYGTQHEPYFKGQQPPPSFTGHLLAEPRLAFYNVAPKTEVSNQDIKMEVDAFYKAHPEALVLTIVDDAMAPLFKAGDFIGGLRLHKGAMEQLIGEIAIIQTLEGQILVRRMNSRTTSGKFRLSVINPNTTAEHFMLEAELVGAAEIVRVWRSPSFVSSVL